MPVVAGRCSRSCEKASKPPADAPMPTIGKRVSTEAECREDDGSGEPWVGKAVAAADVLRAVLVAGLLPAFLAIYRSPPWAPPAIDTNAYIGAPETLRRYAGTTDRSI